MLRSMMLYKAHDVFATPIIGFDMINEFRRKKGETRDAKYREVGLLSIGYG